MTATTLLLRSVGLALVLTSVASAAAAQRQPEPLDPSDPRVRRAAGLVEPILRGDARAAEAYLREHADPAFLSGGEAQRQVQDLLARYGRPGTFEIGSMAQGRRSDVLVFFNSRSGEPGGLVVQLDPAPPHRITGLRVPEFAPGSGRPRSGGASSGTPEPRQPEGLATRTVTPFSSMPPPMAPVAEEWVTLPPDADHPAVRRAAELAALINGGDADAYAAFARASFSPEWVGESSDEELRELYRNLRERAGTAVALRGVDVGAPNQAQAILADASSPRTTRFLFEFEAGPPHRVTPVGIIRSQDTPVPQGREAAPRTVALARPVVEVPLAFDDTGKPLVDVTVNGEGPFRFIVETGANFLALTPAVAERLGDRLRRTGGESIAHVDSVRIGGALLRDLQVGIMPARRGVDGVLGLPAFLDLLLTVDYPAGLLRLERGTLPPPNGRDILPTVRLNEFFGVELEVNGTTVPALIDTQSGEGLSVVPARVQELPFDRSPVTVGEALIGGVHRVPVQGGRLAADARLGAYTFERPLVNVNPRPPSYPQVGEIGAEVLRHFAVTLDQQAERVRFARSSTAPIPAPPSRYSLGFSVSPAPGSLRRVASVVEGSSAQRVGIRAGDELVEVGGVPAAELGPGVMRELARREGAVPVVVRRGGETLRFEVTPVVLIP